MILLILISYDSEQVSGSVDGIAGAICPYLGTFGEQAHIDTTEYLHDLRSGEQGACATLLRVILAGKAKADLPTVVARLERFLKQAAKDSEVALKLTILRLDSKEGSLVTS